VCENKRDTDIEVKSYYDEQTENEWERHLRHPIEFEITKRLLTRHLPKPPAKIIDLGGGPGYYSLWLSQQGYSVTLLDLSPKCIAFARQKAAETGIQIDRYITANILDLSEQITDIFDAVLVMGPLYHLTIKEERIRAVENALHMLKNGGLFVASFISAYAPIIDTLKKYPQNLLGKVKDLIGYFSDGTNIVSDANPGFTAAYFSRIEEIETLMSRFTLKNERLYTVESILGSYEEMIKTCSSEVLDECITLALEFVEDVHCRACGEHYLYVAEKESC
jgi:2-polyprenyl-3-methyl-5-hydroxy-6-metoxy-1,4-benzoquinol methylase